MHFVGQCIKGMGQDVNDTCSFFSQLFSEARHLTRVEYRANRAVLACVAALVCLLGLLVACNQSNSLSLTAFTHLLIFDLLSLVVALTSLWSKRQSPSLETYTLGYERFEVVTVFATTILAILSSFFEIKEAVERVFEPAEVYPNYLIVVCPMALLVHLLIVYGIENPAFGHVISASGSSWLQEHTTDISRTICLYIPGLSRFLLPRINPFALVGFGASAVVMGVYWSMKNAVSGVMDQLHSVGDMHAAGISQLPDPLPDTIGSILISLMLFGTVMPMMLYSGRILLQTIPAHLVSPLDKAFREASTIDGVLELRNEHVWSVGFGNLAGSLYVRVRQDADEQLVLAHMTNRLSSLIKYLTVQVYKDDWTRTSANFAWPTTTAGFTVPNMLPPATSRMHYPIKPLVNTNPHHAQTIPDLVQTMHTVPLVTSDMQPATLKRL